MIANLITKSDSDTLIFHVWKNLKYSYRIVLSISLIIAGLVLQGISNDVMPGIIILIIGNTFLLTKGIDNRLNRVVYKADSKWTKVDSQQLSEIKNINKKLQQWDISAIDITSGLGIAFFMIIVFAGFIALGTYTYAIDPTIKILIINTLVLITPHWFTGVKRITTTPKLVKKIDAFKNVISFCEDVLSLHKLEYNVLLQGKKEKLPKDIKIRVKIKNQPDDFLGVYGQMNMNDVEGKIYPYFYTVLVAKKTFKLLNFKNTIELIPNVIIETKTSGDVDVIVIRQRTTKNSGYHTKPQTMVNLLKLGIKSAERIIQKAN